MRGSPKIADLYIILGIFNIKEIRKSLRPKNILCPKIKIK